MRTLACLALLAATLALPSSAHADCTNDNDCSGGPVRVMFVIDASSDLLNGPMGPAAMGQSPWDHLRAVLALDDAPPGDDSIWAAQVDNGVVVSQIAHVGLIAFGSAGQEVRVVDYGPCTRANVEWAMDPRSSCAAPGCTDPWGGPPIDWTFVDGRTIDPPGFVRETWSDMPQCQGDASCIGSVRAVHAGIELATSNQATYVQQTGYTHDASTLYVNILLVYGSYAGASTDTQVQDALEAAYAAGVTTYVIGVGMAPAMMELDNMASWGSNGMVMPRVAANDDELHDAIQQIIADLELPCCYSIDCSAAGGADEGGIGDSGADSAADGGDWGSLDGGGDASASGGDATADGSADASAGTGSGSAEAGFDDDGGCRCMTDERRASLGWLVLIALGLAPRRRAVAAKRRRPVAY
jgi:hypothetical protein